MPDMGPAGRIVLLIAVVALAAQAVALHYVVDDAFISMRYARNLVEGHGLIYNPGGERVEGYTNFLWTLLLAIGIACRLDPVPVSLVLGIAAGIAALVLSERLARREGIGSWSLLVPLLLAANPALVTWSAGGLETALFTALAAGGALLLAGDGTGPATRKRALGAGVALALCCLTRPEGVFMAALIAAGAILASGRPALGPVRTVALFVGATVLAQEAWRLSYYGAWLPNTFYAKTGDLAFQAQAGARYLGVPLAFFAGGPLVLALVAFGAMRRGQATAISAVVVCGWLVYVALVGGDGLPMFRFLVPALPFLAILIASALARVQQAVPRGAEPLAALAILLTAVPGFVGKQSEYREWDARVFVPKVVRVGKSLRDLVGPDASIALMPAGAIPYYSGLKTLDMLALNDPVVAHETMHFKAELAGHWKYDAASVLRRRPDYILLGNVDVTDSPRQSTPLGFAVEQDLAALPGLYTAYAPVSLPLPGGGWLNCYRRRDLAAPSR